MQKGSRDLTHQRGYSHNQALMAHLELKKGKRLTEQKEPAVMRNSLGVHPLSLNLQGQVKHRQVNSVSQSQQQNSAVLDSSLAYGSSDRMANNLNAPH